MKLCFSIIWCSSSCSNFETSTKDPTAPERKANEICNEVYQNKNIIKSMVSAVREFSLVIRVTWIRSCVLEKIRTAQ